MSDDRPVIFVVSDGRGETCRQYLQAALVQYADLDVETVVRSNVLSPELVVAVVDEAAARGGVVFYTLVAEDTRRAMRRHASEQLVTIVDVLGPAFGALHEFFQQDSLATPGLFYAAERTRIDREAAVDFALKHDDGLRLTELYLADVVLVGVSRVAKSTTSFYLGYNGIKAANVPLVVGTPLLKELLAMDSRKVIGLRMNVTRLMAVRDARARHLGPVGTADYVDKRAIADEVRRAHEIMQEYGWRSFDVSYMAVEEVAREVLRLLGRKAGTGH
ncbi:MAG: kinase/pyrophosphorylase [bacterium]|nr:kinase/pyrophosphorylase [bacterium]